MRNAPKARLAAADALNVQRAEQLKMRNAPKAMPTAAGTPSVAGVVKDGGVPPSASAPAGVGGPAALTPASVAQVANVPVRASDSSVLNNGAVDWDQMGRIAKTFGVSLLGLLQSPIAGYVAAKQGRGLDWQKETLLGQQEAQEQLGKQAEKQQKQIVDPRGWEGQLAELNRQAQAKQAQADRDFERVMATAKTDAEKEAATVQHQREIEMLDKQNASAYKIASLRSSDNAKTLPADPNKLRG